MNVYIFENLESVSYRYHSDGGAVIIARDEPHAAELAAAYNRERSDSWFDEEGDDDATRPLVLPPQPWGELPAPKSEWHVEPRVTVVPTSEDAEPALFVFPNAGCC